MIQQPVYKARTITVLEDKVRDLIQGRDYKIASSIATVTPHQLRSMIAPHVEEYVLNLAHQSALKCIAEWEDYWADRGSYLNCYCRLSDDKDAVITTWTFSDRNAAMMFKLSLA